MTLGPASSRKARTGPAGGRAAPPDRAPAVPRSSLPGGRPAPPDGRDTARPRPRSAPRTRPRAAWGHEGALGVLHQPFNIAFIVALAWPAEAVPKQEMADQLGESARADAICLHQSDDCARGFRNSSNNGRTAMTISIISLKLSRYATIVA